MRNRQDAQSYGHPYKNPFDEGWRKNLRRIFGHVPWYKNAFPSLHRPPEPKYPFELGHRSVDSAILLDV